jgi:hypothetical protein
MKMRYEVKKIAKIVDEVITFFLFNYAEEASVELKCREDVSFIKFKFSPVELDEKEFKKLEKKFSAERQPELENYYWQLAGETEDENEISLVAMMCDTCKMSLSGKTLEIELTRKLK